MRRYKVLVYFHQMLVLLENELCSSGRYPPACFFHCVLQ